MTEAMPRVKFSELMRPNSRPYMLAPDQDANLVGMRLYGQGPFHRELKSAMRILKKTHFQIRTGDVIYNKLFAWKGCFGLVPFELDGMFVSDKFPTYDLNRSRVDPSYLSWYFRHTDIWEQARQKSTGTAALSKFTLNPPKFLELEIPLPSLGEQHRMASKIDALAEKIANAKKTRSATDNWAQSFVSSVCEFYLQKWSSLAEMHPLQRLVEAERGISYGIVQTGSEFDGGVPTLRAGDLHWFEVETQNIKKVDPAIERSFQRTRLRGGELLLRIRGGIGEVAVAPTGLCGGNVSREIAVIPLTEKIDPQFAMFMLAAPTSQTKMRGHLRGTAYVGINLKDVRTLQIPVPSLAQQQSIVEEICDFQNRTDTVLALQAHTSSSMDAVIPSVLDHAFRGKL
jgi:type I restriction enzyme, S subunit